MFSAQGLHASPFPSRKCLRTHHTSGESTQEQKRKKTKKTCGASPSVALQVLSLLALGTVYQLDLAAPQLSVAALLLYVGSYQVWGPTPDTCGKPHRTGALLSFLFFIASLPSRDQRGGISAAALLV